MLYVCFLFLPHPASFLLCLCCVVLCMCVHTGGWQQVAVSKLH